MQTKKITQLLFMFFIGVLVFAFTVPTHFFQSKDNMLSDQEKKEGWTLLFDGKTTTGWKTYKNLPQDSWEVVNGELHCKEKDVQKRADMMPVDMYGSFEIQLDWKISKACNSGLLYHVLETHDAPYETGPEYQLIDDVGYGEKEKLQDWQKSGADYAMHPPSKLATRPAGEFNHTRLVVNGSHVEHWLNGVKVVEFEAWTPEWQKLKAEGKWKDHPDYGLAKSGYISLQDHGGGISFKNIKIKKL